MVQPNLNIPLAFQAPDFVGSVARGHAAGQQANEFRHQNALRSAFQEHGAGLVAGDAGARNALAALDPQMVMQADNQRSIMGDREQRLQMAYEQSKRQAEQHAMQMTAAERQMEAQQLESALAAATQIQTPEQWDSFMQQRGMPQLVGEFENRDIHIASAMAVKDALAVTGQGGRGDETFGLSPMHGFDADGNPVVMQLGNRGSINAVEFPEGVTPSPGGTQRVDLGTHIAILDRDGRMIDRIEKDVFGTPGSGEQIVRTDEGLTTEEIPGGAAERARLASERERDQAGRTASTTASIAVRELDDLLAALGADPDTGEIVGNRTIPGRRGRALYESMPGVGGIMARDETVDFMNNVASLKDTIAINRLLEIKASGAGLGAIPQAQLEALARALGNMSVSTSDEMLARNLADVRRIYADIIERSLADVNDPTFRGMLDGIQGGGGQPNAAPTGGNVGGIEWSIEP